MTDTSRPSRLECVADLRSIYRMPGSGPVDKVIDRLDAHCIDFLAQSPLVVVATADANGVCDASPRGGPPGFVEAIDGERLAWADLSGNNRLDSFINLVVNPRIALLFMIPGLDETLRVNGSAALSTDADLCQRFSVSGRPAKVVVAVTVVEAYLHCAKALRRADVWSTDTWPEPAGLPSASRIVKDHVGIDASIEEIEAARRHDLDETLWRPGGEAGDSAGGGDQE